MDGRENTCVDYVFGFARNARLVEVIGEELSQAEKKSLSSGKAERVFKDFMWTTLKSWPCERRVIAKAEWTGGEANPRFVVTSLKRRERGARASLQGHLLRARRDGEPDQGPEPDMPGGPVLGPDVDGDDEGKPAASLVRLYGLKSSSHALRRIGLADT
jgi:hypothetical protein